MKVHSILALLTACFLLTSCSVQIIGYGTTAEGEQTKAPDSGSNGPSAITTSVPIQTTQPPTTNTPVPPTTDLPSVPVDIVGEIPESAAVEPSWFDDACFIGDSITEGLRTYALTGALGSAQFFAVRSYSTINALRPLSDDGPHPTYQGERMTAIDCVAKSGAKKVYLMLGTNDLYNGIDASVKRYQQLIEKILEKSPDVKIFVQSMTPMTASSSYIGEMLNNDNIKLYNEKLLSMCEENGWYFVNVAAVMYEPSGEALSSDYCSDKTTMGVHFNPKGYQQWVAYLRTHTVKMGE